jgi:hypothetical protein
MRTWFCLGLLGLSLDAHAVTGRVGGYVRVNARPSFQGGMGSLGYSNLYGRLLNEGPYAALNMDLDVLEPTPGGGAPWTRIHGQVEGGSVEGMDAGGGSLDHFRLSQLHILAGNVLIQDVTWQAGTLESSMGDMGLYDMRPATLFDRTVGMSARWESESIDLLLGVGDSGFSVRGERYNPILTAGGSVRMSLAEHAQFGIGGELLYEAEAKGNTHAPLRTPGLNTEEWVRGEVLQRFRAQHPIAADRFPSPEPTSAESSKLIAYAGFGGWGAFRWNSTYLSWSRLHPEGPTQEVFEQETADIYPSELTDERQVLQVGNELLFTPIPERLDVAWGVLFGDHTDRDNDILPSDHDRTYLSTVLRVQTAISQTFGVLTEMSVAKEWSRNGNTYREHEDSIFANTDGAPDTRGLETGESDTRRTWQGKAGLVFTPMGPSIWSRPTIRLLWGSQWSSQNNAYPNAYVEDVDQYNEFGNVEQHWHHLVAMEAEAWF